MDTGIRVQILDEAICISHRNWFNKLVGRITSPDVYIDLLGGVGFSVLFNGISTFVGYLMPKQYL